MRAKLARYRFNESQLKEKLAEMDSSIGSRLQALMAAKNKRELE